MVMLLGRRNKWEQKSREVLGGGKDEEGRTEHVDQNKAATVACGGHHDNLAQRVTKLGAQRQYDGICCRWYWGAHVPEWLLNFSGPRAFTLFGMW